jgi:hypothetical protein
MQSYFLLRPLFGLWGLSNLLRGYLGYGYGLVYGHVPSSPGTQLSTLGRQSAQAFSRSNHLATPDPKQENNHRTPNKSQVPHADRL